MANETRAKKPKLRSSIREDAINVPNLLTMARVVMIPLVLWLIADGTPSACFWAAMVYMVTAITDALDGWLARKMGLISILGKFLDPLADKLLVTAALVSLVSLNRLPAWVAMVIIAREFAVTGLRSLAADRGVIIAASWMGKVKTVLQIAMVFALIAFNPAPPAVDALVYLAVLATLISGFDYFFGLRRRFAEQRSSEAGSPDRDSSV